MAALLGVTVTSLADMVSRLNTFLVAEGWTTHHVPASGEFAARKTGTGIDVAAAFQWDTGSPNNLGVYHWVGGAYDNTQDPWSQPASGAVKDSGNGFAGTADASLGTSRHSVIGNTPLRLWAFSDTYYCHAVVETATDIATHFGFGHLNKYGTWTGGGYAYGMRHDTALTTPIGRRGHSYMLDGFANQGPPSGIPYCATLHATALPGLSTTNSSLFGVCADRNTAPGNDRQTVARVRSEILGGYRGQPGGNDAFGFMLTDSTDAYLPGVPIYCVYRDDTSDPPVLYTPLGEMADVRQVIMKNWTFGQSLFVGGDTWYLFPMRKIADNDSDGGGSKSGWAGVAYKLVA